MRRGRIQAVTLDAGGTLVRPWPSVGAVYAGEIRRLGLPVPDEALLERRFQDAWRARSGFDYSRQAWSSLVARVLSERVAPGEIPRVFERVWTRFMEADAWRVYPDVVPCLAALRAMGVRLAVLSNWDERLHPVMRAVGLSDSFEFVLPSVEGPAPKPDVRLFRVAADRLSLPPGALLHVGDSWRDDVVGARAAGWVACWLCRDAPSGNRVTPETIRSLLELPSRVAGG